MSEKIWMQSSTRELESLENQMETVKLKMKVMKLGIQQALCWGM